MFVNVYMLFGSQREGRMQSTSKEILVIFGRGIVFVFLKRKKRGIFRVWVDECVDGGILIGVILT